jgi:dienelactone hydrolase
MKNHFFLWILLLAVLLLPSHAQPSKALKSQEIIDLAKEFVDHLAKEDYEKAEKDFSETMRKSMPPTTLERKWKNLLAQTGSFKKQTEIQTDKMNQYDIVFVSCEFEKSPFVVKVVFNEYKKISGLWFFPNQPSGTYISSSYSEPDSFQEKDVVLGKGEWKLPGTLTIPKGDGPFSAVVLVHGSGPLDRDETIGPNKPFRDLAWGLASQGIAVLRYEKRTKEHGAKLSLFKEIFTVQEETIEDALAAASLLRKTEKINSKKIFILGHSLGGTLIPRMGIQDPNIAGFIIMAGATKPLTDLYIEQVVYICTLDGIISDIEKEQLEKAIAQVERVMDPQLPKDTPPSELPFNTPASYWLDLRDYHPSEIVKKLTQPMLILQGERDYQVTMENFKDWQLSLSSRKDVTFKSYPHLNHLFMAGEGKSTPEEYQTPRNVAVMVIYDIAHWIKKN